MRNRACRLAVLIAPILALAAGIGALAQAPKHMEFSGTINDFTPASTGGPWEVRGHWSLTVNRWTGKAEFSAALTMERSDLGVMLNGGGDLNNPADRNAHTHHVTLTDGEVTTIPGGIQVTGTATVTGNGTVPPPFGSATSAATIDITGGNSVTFSNVALLFGGDAAKHFGSNPLHGVVRIAEYGDTPGRW